MARDGRRRLIAREQGLERRRGVRIDRAAALLEFLDVVAHQHMPGAGVDALVDHRDDVGAQGLARRLDGKIGAEIE